MAVYFVTGKLGSGKTLAAVGKIRDYVRQGRRIATNLDLYFDQWENKKKKNVDVIRLPDKPSASDMLVIGRGYEGSKIDESRNGLLVLDECGTWFNSRTWNDKDRHALIDWFLHARKLRWDILFLIQDLSIVDKQARETLCEHLVFCKRLDKVGLPFITALIKLVTGYRITLPKAHLGIVKYGDSQTSLTVDRWWYRAQDLYRVYDTEQVFSSSNDGISCMLSPWHVAGRYLGKRRSVFQLLMYALGWLSTVLVYFLSLGNLKPFGARPLRSLSSPSLSLPN